LYFGNFRAATTLYFRDNPLKITKGFKQYLYDENGKEYLDCINNVAHGKCITCMGT